MSDVVLQIVFRILAPFLQVYGLYLVFWGHSSPGGSFAGGAVIAVSFLLGSARARFVAWRQTVQWLAALGGMAFLILGLTGIFQGSAFLTNISGQFLHVGLIPLLAASLGLLVVAAIFSFVAYLIEEEKNV